MPLKEPKGGQPHESESPPLEAVVKAYAKKAKKRIIANARPNTPGRSRQSLPTFSEEEKPTKWKNPNMTTGLHNVTTSAIPHPSIASREQWLTERKKLLEDEKELIKHYDRVNAQRRRLPIVKVENDYTFDGPNGKTRLQDLFEGRRQLIVYHFMFDPSWDKGCSGCTGFVDALGDLSLLSRRDTTFVLVSRAPLAKLDAYKAEKRWSITWVSSFGSDFNYDFHVTLDPKVAPAEYNYRNKAEMAAAKGHSVLMEGEEHGLSVSFRSTTMFSTRTRFTRVALNR